MKSTLAVNKEKIREQILEFKSVFDIDVATPFFSIPDKFKKKITLSVSGGVDSMSMLLNFIILKHQDNSFEFDVVNFEHGLRGDISKLDSYFVKEFCHVYGIECTEVELDIFNKKESSGFGIEETARIERHNWYKKHNKETGNYIALAHNINDATESILMHVFRGSGYRGIIGMGYEDGIIIRPLIGISRFKIESFVKETGLIYRNDETNFTNDYTRNYIRNEILPVIKKIYPEIDNSLARFSNNMKTVDAILNRYSADIVIEKDGRVEIDIESLKTVEGMSGDVIKYALRRLQNDIDFSKKNIDDIYALVFKNNGTQIVLPHGLIAAREYSNIAIYKDCLYIDNYNKIFSVGRHELPDCILRVKEIHERLDNYEDGIYIDRDKIPEGSLIRHRKSMDVFTTFSGHTKKLSKYLIDKKVPKRERETLYVVANGDDVLIVLGYEQSNKLKIDENTTRIIKIEMER